MSKGPLFGRPIGTAPGAATTTTPAPAAASAAAPATTPAPAAASAAAPATTPSAATVENLKRQVLQLTSERDAARKERDNALAAERAAKEAQKKVEQVAAEAQKRVEQAEAEAKKKAEEIAAEVAKKRAEALAKRLAAARLTPEQEARINKNAADINALRKDTEECIKEAEERAAGELGSLAAVLALGL